ncbi:T9SS type A sorting domain-containing protein [Aestuariivivens sediminis]|uniref:T9SS type A sorting domain-containing protein n=1 Tax=Aestuariivivens sediminis TaxID=2913557 RepID=UPI001F576F37|nr:T9SS type A sorting domain-containing protein [Aestuariivivens sediminis]
MKQKTTLLLFVFFITLVSFGQTIKSQNNRNYEKYRIESQLELLNLGENKFGKVPIIIKSKGFFENSMVTSSQEISSPSIIKYGLDYEIIQNWNETSNQLENHRKTEYTYDEKGKMTQYSVAHWDGILWETGWKIEYIYDDYFNIIQEIESYWWEGQWLPDFKNEYTYDLNGNPIEIRYYTWSEGQWVMPDKTKLEYTYDTSGSVTQCIQYDWDGNQWIIDLKTEYSLDNNGNLTHYTNAHWDGGQWFNTMKMEFYYDSIGEFILSISYEWVGSDWDFDYKTEYTYDSNGNIIYHISYNWDQFVNQWNIRGKLEYTYNNSYSFSDLILPNFYRNTEPLMLFSHMMTNVIMYNWDININDWAIIGAIDLSYSEMEILSVSEMNKDQLKVYPNPVSNILTVKSDSVPIDAVEIYSVLGKKIKAIYSDFENIHTVDLSQGIYLIRIYSENRSIVKKLIKN